MTALPQYDEIDYIMAPERKIDIKTFLDECPSPECAVVLNPSTKRALGRPPGYTCTVSRTGLASRKMENSVVKSGEIYAPFRRNWHDVLLVIQGTKLAVYKAGPNFANSELQRLDRTSSSDRSISRFRRPEGGATNASVRPRSTSLPDTSCVADATRLIKEYSLLGAVAGIACDYVKRENVLRLRVENDQFLLQCGGSRDVIDWLEAIQKGANISEPLESRFEPRFVCGPRRRNRLRIKAQAYEVFEAPSPEGPLCQKTHIAYPRMPIGRRHDLQQIETRPGTSPRLLRTGESDEDLRRTAAHMSLDPPMSAHPTFSARGDSPGRVSLQRPPLLPQSRKNSSMGDKRSCPSRLSTGQRQKAERYICPILTASHPRTEHRAAMPVC